MEKSITDISIFGEYQQSENRVTAALLHILHLGGQPVVQRLFGDLFDIPSNRSMSLHKSKKKIRLLMKLSRVIASIASLLRAKLLAMQSIPSS